MPVKTTDSVELNNVISLRMGECSRWPNLGHLASVISLRMGKALKE